MKLTKYKYTEFKPGFDNTYIVRNKIYNIDVGYIKKARMGRWMHWCFFPHKDTKFSNGCLKEISDFIRLLYTMKKK